MRWPDSPPRTRAKAPMSAFSNSFLLIDADGLNLTCTLLSGHGGVDENERNAANRHGSLDRPRRSGQGDTIAGTFDEQGVEGDDFPAFGGPANTIRTPSRKRSPRAGQDVVDLALQGRKLVRKEVGRQHFNIVFIEKVDNRFNLRRKAEQPRSPLLDTAGRVPPAADIAPHFAIQFRLQVNRPAPRPRPDRCAHWQKRAREFASLRLAQIRQRRELVHYSRDYSPTSIAVQFPQHSHQSLYSVRNHRTRASSSACPPRSLKRAKARQAWLRQVADEHFQSPAGTRAADAYGRYSGGRRTARAQNRVLHRNFGKISLLSPVCRPETPFARNWPSIKLWNSLKPAHQGELFSIFLKLVPVLETPFIALDIMST